MGKLCHKVVHVIPVSGRQWGLGRDTEGVVPVIGEKDLGWTP